MATELARRVEQWALGRSLGKVDAVIFLVFIGTALPLALWQVHDVPLFPGGMDAPQWVAAAKDMADGEVLRVATSWRPPVYPATVALLSHLGVDLERASCLVPLVCWVLLLGLTYLATVTLAGRGPALLAALMTSFMVPLISVAVQANSQGLFNAQIALYLWLGYRLSDSRRPVAWVALGLITGVVLATKEQGLVIAMAVLLWQLLAHKSSGGWRRLRRPAWFLAGAVIPAALYLVPAVLMHPKGSDGSKLGSLAADIWAILTTEDWRTVWIPDHQVQQLLDRSAHTGPGLLRLVRFSLEVTWNWLGDIRLLLGGAAVTLPLLLLPAGRPLRRPAAWCLLLLAPLAVTALLAIHSDYHLSYTAIPLAALTAMGAAILARTALSGIDRWAARTGAGRSAAMTAVVVACVVGGAGALILGGHRWAAGDLRFWALSNLTGDLFPATDWLRRNRKPDSVVISPLAEFQLARRALVVTPPARLVKTSAAAITAHPARDVYLVLDTTQQSAGYAHRFRVQHAVKDMPAGWRHAWTHRSRVNTRQVFILHRPPTSAPSP